MKQLRWNLTYYWIVLLNDTGITDWRFRIMAKKAYRIRRNQLKGKE